MEDQQLPGKKPNNSAESGAETQETPTSDRSENAPIPRKSHIRGLLILLILSVVVGAAGYFIAEQNTVRSPNSANQTPVADEPKALSKDNLYFQLDTRIIAYDPETKVKTTLTDKLPPVAQLLDFYHEPKAWRAYYETTAEDGTTGIYFIENGKTAEQMYASEASVIAAANAKTKTIAYTEVYASDPEAPAAEQVSRHYVIQAGQTTKLKESALAFTARPPKDDLANPGYAVSAISPDGAKILFHYYGKFYSDGGSLGGGLEFDLASKHTTLIRDTGSVGYDSQGNYLSEISNRGGLGFQDQPLQLTVSTSLAPGEPFQEKLNINEPTWAVVSYRLGANFFAAEAMTGQYTTTGETLFAGFYKVGASPSDYEKLEIPGLPTDTHAFYAIGVLPSTNPEARCFGVVLNARGADVLEDAIDAEYRLGVFCADTSGALQYEEIETYVYDNYVPAAVL